MLLNKQALIITVNIEGKQVGGALCFLGDKTLYYAITTFDSDYFKFNLGHEIIMQLLNWCYDNGYHTYDFSKGEYEYKTRWTNTVYHYENHILYDSQSIKARIIANCVSGYFKLKQYLRDKNINEKYVKLKFLLKGKKATVSRKSRFAITKSDVVTDVSKMELIDLDAEAYLFLKPLLYNELFKNPEPISGLKTYQTNSSGKKSYHVVGEKNNYNIVAKQ